MTDPDGLNRVIDDAFAALAAGDDTWPRRFTRCWTLAQRFEHHGRQTADLDTALVEFGLLPPDAPGRAILAAELARLHVRTGLVAPGQLQQAEELAAIVDAALQQPSGWLPDRAGIRALWLLNSLGQGVSRADLDRILVELDRLEAQVEPDHPQALAIEMGRLGALHMRARHDGDLVGVERIAERMAELRAGFAAGSPQAVLASFMEATQRAQVAGGRGDRAAMDAERSPGPSS